MTSLWDELKYEVGTVRALSAAALEARSESSRLALITLLAAETAEISVLVERILREAQRPAA